MANKRLDDYVESSSKEIASQIFKFFDSQQAQNGPDFVSKLTQSFLRRYIYVIVMNTLSSVPQNPATDSEVAGFVNKKYSTLKFKMQEAIAMGFQNALSDYEGRQVEYYCQLVPVSQPVNKQPC